MTGNLPKVVARWNLRQVMAEHGMFQTSDLLEPLHARGIQLSRQMVHRIVTKTPQRINLDVLVALCDILDCSPGDLVEVAYEQRQSAPTAGGEESGPGIGDLRPIRARIRRPGQ